MDYTVCDCCGVTCKSPETGIGGPDWQTCYGINSMDFCPDCWENIMKFIVEDDEE